VAKDLATSTFEIVVFAIFIALAAAATNVSWHDRATMTNTFATISGVFLGLYFVIRNKKAERNRDVSFFLLLSIFACLISSMISYDQTSSPFWSQYAAWVASALVFGGSTAYFAVHTDAF
jgi:peptidoglycan/LPS O-acetylase OafA/YrhL